VALTDRNFGGNVWEFIVQADSIGVKNMDGTAKRQWAPEELKELDAT
jgi:hypothetical protein